MRLRPWMIVNSVLIFLIIGVMVFLQSSSPVPTRSQLDSEFESITLGMSRSDIESLMGPALDTADAKVREIVGFRPHVQLRNRSWWLDGQYKCLSVEFDSNGRVQHAELFTHNSFVTRKLTQ